MKISGSKLLSGMRHKQESTKDNIKTSTFRLLAEHGYANISMRDIAAEAGVALSQIAYYYHSKDALISAVASEAVDRFVEGFDCALDAPGGDPLAAARDYFARISCGGEGSELWRVVLDFVGQASWVPAFRDSINEFFTRLSGILDEKINSSDCAKINARETIGALFGSSVMRLYAAGV